LDEAMKYELAADFIEGQITEQLFAICDQKTEIMEFMKA
jgi:hypothetical protein